MTDYLYRLILDVTVKADSKEDADEIGENIELYNMDVDVWSSEIQYKGIDKESE